jgi:uncharacterized membrane protein
MTAHRSTASPVLSPSRFDAVDALRGLAMVWMTVFHFCFDLNHFRYIQQDFYADPFWTWQRTAIVSLFLFTAGLGQAIAVQQGQRWPRFWRRWAQIAVCALLVTASSYWMYPGSFIYFGVLHGMAVMLLIARGTAGWGRWLLPLGAVAIALPFIASYVHSTMGSSHFLSYFDRKGLNWLGWSSRTPQCPRIGTGPAGTLESDVLHGAPARDDWRLDGTGCPEILRTCSRSPFVA